MESASIEESDTIKAPTQEDLEGLRYHTNSAANSKGATAFLRGKWSMNWEEEKEKKDMSNDQVEEEDDDDADAGEDVDAVKRAQAFSKNEAELTKLDTAMQSAVTTACERISSIHAVEQELGSFMGDVAFASYTSTSLFRLSGHDLPWSRFITSLGW